MYGSYQGEPVEWCVLDSRATQMSTSVPVNSITIISLIAKKMNCHQKAKQPLH